MCAPSCNKAAFVQSLVAFWVGQYSLFLIWVIIWLTVSNHIKTAWNILILLLKAF